MGPEAKPGTKSKVEPEAKPKVEPEAKPKVEPEAKPKVEPEAKSKVELEAKSKVEPEAKSKVEPEAKPKVKSGVRPKVKSGAKPKAEPGVGPKTKPKAEAGKETIEKDNGEHSFISNYWYLYKGFFKNSRWNILITAMILIGGVTASYVQLFIPKTAVALVTEGVPEGTLVGTLLGMSLLYYLFYQANWVGYMLLGNPSLKYRHALEERMLKKICRTPYSNLEDSDYKKRISRAQHLYYHWDRDARVCIWNSLHAMSLLVMIPISSGMLVTLHPVIILVMAAGTWLQYVADRRPLAWEKKHRDKWIPLERKSTYVSEKMGNFPCAKDMRLYAADRWLLPKYKRLLGERRKWKKKQLAQITTAGFLSRMIEMIKQAFVYGFLIWGVTTGKVRPDDFILYVGVALNLSDCLTQIEVSVRRLRENELSIADYRKMMELPDYRGAGAVRGQSFRNKPLEMTGKPDICEPAAESPVLPGGRAPGITFSHVSFSYQEGGEETLKDVDIAIRPGEKIALVGPNGAGKTTLIKLLCGMYEPAKGEILLDGEPSSRWSLEEWYRLFSVVFQDVGVLPATILENVAACAPEEADRERVRKCLEQAGLWEKVESLPHGMDSNVQKEVFSEGQNLSGGENQKLLLARAIYREAPILVLDEPTAALDAIAENELYQRYNELTRNRTSLFISHRLASTRFCDRILMLEGGRVVEQGSHEELMEKKGAYYRMFQVQSHYYQKDRAEGFSSRMDPAWEVSGYVSN